MRDAAGLEFDVMLEGKSKDISLLKLRPDLLRYAPDVAARFGIYPAEAAALAAGGGGAGDRPRPGGRPGRGRGRLNGPAVVVPRGR